MSIFRRVLGLDSSATGPGASQPGGIPVGETDSVRRITARLAALPPERARFVAAFAYLLGRAANADLAVTEAETAEMTRLLAEVGELDPATASLVAELAGSRAERFGATEDYLVTREFKAISTPEDRERLLRCCLLVVAADDDVDAEEAWLVNRLAEELEVDRADLNRIRAEFTDRIGGVRELRRLRDEEPPEAPSADASADANADAKADAKADPPPELPDGVTIEGVFLVEVPYTPEAAERRPRYRREHLARIARLKREGRIIEAGGATDFSKAVLLIRAADAAEALRLIEEDVYTSGGVWHSPTATAFGRVVPGPAAAG